MIRSIFVLVPVFCLLVCGCPGNSRETQNVDLKPDTPKVDPMVFVVLHRVQIESILKEKPDCEAALAELLRFIADRKKSFNQLVKDKPADWQPEGVQSDGPIQPLMDYSENCPEQVVRLNQAIRSVVE